MFPVKVNLGLVLVLIFHLLICCTQPYQFQGQSKAKKTCQNLKSRRIHSSSVLLPPKAKVIDIFVQKTSKDTQTINLFQSDKKGKQTKRAPYKNQTGFNDKGCYYFRIYNFHFNPSIHRSV